MRTQLRRSLAASAVAALTAAPLLGLAAPAQAHGPDAQGKPGHAGKPAAPGKSGEAGKPTQPTEPAGKPANPGKPEQAGKPANPGKPEQAGKPANHGKPEQTGKPANPGKPEQAGKPANPSKGAGQGDPSGNNGTVKIAGPGDAVGHPSNNPHPGCTFLVEWYGFDQGDDVVSTVTFAPHAPTADVVLGGTAPSQVFVGGDAAGGGTDLDGRQAYTLTFDGAPHPKQGYHVKLTVATPHSLGSDTKSKVFWVEPCQPVPAPDTVEQPGDEQPGVAVPGVAVPELPAGGEAPLTIEGVGSLLGLDGAAPSEEVADADVLGVEQYARDGSAPVAGRAGVNLHDDDVAVPTAVDAGGVGDWSRSLVPLTLVGLGVAATVGGLLHRRKTNNA